MLRKIGWNLGLTREGKTELSNILYDTAVVYKRDRSVKDLEISDSFTRGRTPVDVPLRSSMTGDEENYIKFEGSNITIALDDEEICDQFKDGETVRLKYRKIQVVVFDYEPPNFEKKKPLRKVLTGYRLYGAVDWVDLV